MSDDVEPTAFDQFDQDDELRALLHASDPARSLQPADSAAMASLLAYAMSSDHTAPTRRHRPLSWLVGAAAAAVVVTAGVGAVAREFGGDDHRAPQATAPHHSSPPPVTTSPSQPATPAVTRLTLPAVSGRCAVPSTQMLSGLDTAFEAKVIGLTDESVTLQPTSTYRGRVGQTVQLQAPPSGLGQLVQSVHFRLGRQYLISAADGQVALCGLSGPAKSDLDKLYSKAFAH